jgi:hypothetical protein
VIEADEDLLERAFENLVRNARDAAGPSGQVWIEVERGRDSVLVTIADNGPGMPPDVRSSLRPFFTTKSGGLGLGLPLAYKIVRPARRRSAASRSVLRTVSPCGSGSPWPGQLRTCRLRMVTRRPLETVCATAHLPAEVESSQHLVGQDRPRYVNC